MLHVLMYGGQVGDNAHYRLVRGPCRAILSIELRFVQRATRELKWTNETLTLFFLDRTHTSFRPSESLV